MNIQYIDTNEKVSEFLDILTEEKTGAVAVDIEGEYNLHQYGEKLCLIQVFDGRREVVIDPFSVDLEHIVRLFGNRDVKKIMYDASSDQKLILKQYGVRINSIIDLRPAAELLDLPKQDLASVVELFLNIRKTKNYQTYNWTRRPVEPGALEYAMNDVVFLFDLRDRLFMELKAAGKMEEYLRKNEAVNTREINLDREPGFFRKPAFQKLRGKDKARVKKIFYIREAYAEKYNVPPHQIFANHKIVHLGTGRSRPLEVGLLGRMDSRDREAILSEITAVLKQE